MDPRPRPPVPDATSHLLTRIRAGDEQALETLMLRDLEWIQAYVRRNLGGIVRRNAETGDVVHEVFLRVLRKGPQFIVSGRVVFRRLMARIISNTLVSMARRYNAKARASEREHAFGTDSVLYLDGDPPAMAVTEPPEHAARVEERELVRLAMELMEPFEQELLHQRDTDELSFREIGDRIGLAENSTRMRYKRAVKKLSRMVAMITRGELAAVLAKLEGQAAADLAS